MELKITFFHDFSCFFILNAWNWKLQQEESVSLIIKFCLNYKIARSIKVLTNVVCSFHTTLKTLDGCWAELRMVWSGWGGWGDGNIGGVVWAGKGKEKQWREGNWRLFWCWEKFRGFFFHIPWHTLLENGCILIIRPNRIVTYRKWK